MFPTLTAFAALLLCPPRVTWQTPELGLWHDLVYHEKAQKLLLVNGGPETETPTSSPIGLWEWTGSEWRAFAAGGGPRWRNQASIAYDSRRGVLVLYGGVRPGEDLADTWEFDGERWSERASGEGPGPREGAGLAFDSKRGVSVLFGGAARGEMRGDTWEWDGAQWSLREEAGPAPRFPAGFAYDAKRGVVLLFGGHVVDARGFRTLGDTWTWDGTTWKELDAAGPAPRDGARAVFDPARGAVVLFGGAEIERGSVRYFDDTWTFDGARWTKLALAGPKGRVHAALALDPRRSRLVLAGGSNAPSALLPDVWELDGERWSCVHACDDGARER